MGLTDYYDNLNMKVIILKWQFWNYTYDQRANLKNRNTEIKWKFIPINFVCNFFLSSALKYKSMTFKSYLSTSNKSPEQHNMFYLQILLCHLFIFCLVCYSLGTIQPVCLPYVIYLSCYVSCLRQFLPLDYLYDISYLDLLSDLYWPWSLRVIPNIILGGGSHSIMANVLDCDIIVSSNSSPSITYIFTLIQLGKGVKPIIFSAMG